MNTLGQQMALARGGSGAGQRAGAGPGLRGRGLRWGRPAQRLVQRAGRPGLGAGRRQHLHAHLQLRRRRGRHRLSLRPALPGRPRRRLHPRHAVGERLHGPGLDRQRSASRPTAASRKAGFYVDALAGYAYFNNQLQRQIPIPGLQQRTATGSTGANQFLGQVETGYRLGVYAPASATLTPFGRLPDGSVTQNAFTESGAQSLNLNVAQQTTNSLRTVLGADLGSSIGLGNERKLDLGLRLGWHARVRLHRPADHGGVRRRALGTPSPSTAPRRSATRPSSASRPAPPSPTATQLYLRYDGEVGARHRQPRAQCRLAHELVAAPRTHRVRSIRRR